MIFDFQLRFTVMRNIKAKLSSLSHSLLLSTHPEGTSIGSDNCDFSKVSDPHSKQLSFVLIASF